eukprot:jgi/Chrzof1/6183/Cz17g14180.t1
MAKLCLQLSTVWVLAVLCCTPAVVGRKIFAIIPYNVKGKSTIVGPDGAPGRLTVGSQVLYYLTMTNPKTGDVLGSVAGHCHVVKSGGSGNIAACTKHYDFADGSSMTGHATETINGNAVIKARHVIAGGIGQWEGAHGEDVAYSYNPATATGSGKIVLTCLKGVC